MKFQCLPMTSHLFLQTWAMGWVDPEWLAWMSGHITAKVMSLNEFPGYLRRFQVWWYIVYANNLQIDLVLYVHYYMYIYTYIHIYIQLKEVAHMIWFDLVVSLWSTNIPKEQLLTQGGKTSYQKLDIHGYSMFLVRLTFFHITSSDLQPSWR